MFKIDPTSASLKYLFSFLTRSTNSGKLWRHEARRINDRFNTPGVHGFTSSSYGTDCNAIRRILRGKEKAIRTRSCLSSEQVGDLQTLQAKSSLLVGVYGHDLVEFNVRLAHYLYLNSRQLHEKHSLVSYIF